MAAARIDNEAWSDPRFSLLAKLCGLDHPHFALIKCVWLWSYCTEKNVTVVRPEIIDAHVGMDGFAEKLVTSELGERVEGGVRVCGTKGRIEWLTKKRVSGKAGGAAKASNLLANARSLPSDNLAAEYHTNCIDSEATPSKRLAGASERLANARKVPSTSEASAKLTPSEVLPSFSSSSSFSEENSNTHTNARASDGFVSRETEPRSVGWLGEACERVAQDIRALTGCAWDSAAHAQKGLSWIAQQSAEEWAAVRKGIAADSWARENPERITPQHIVGKWPAYLRGATKGYSTGSGPVRDASEITTENNPEWARVP